MGKVPRPLDVDHKQKGAAHASSKLIRVLAQKFSIFLHTILHPVASPFPQGYKFIGWSLLWEVNKTSRQHYFWNMMKINTATARTIEFECLSDTKEIISI